MHLAEKICSSARSDIWVVSEMVSILFATLRYCCWHATGQISK